MSSSWGDERRRTLAVEAEQRRKNKDADSELRRKEVAAEDKRRRDEARADRDERREAKLQRRRDRVQRRHARVARREKALTPGNVYRKGTLALVAASALASLPAQILHFIGISGMLLPLPFAIEGAAWVMNAGVAYADEKRLPAWVRWLLRALAMSAALFAASINYSYGTHLKGLDPSEQSAAGLGLAAVTMGGPLFFEVRQWVLTLSAAADPKRREERRKAAHEKARQKHHKNVVELAERLMSAATYNTLSFERAFAAAWEIVHGTRVPGMTPALHSQAYTAKKALATAFDDASGSPESVRAQLLEVIHPAPIAVTESAGSSQVVTDLPPVSKDPSNGASKAGRKRGATPPPPHRRRKGDALPFHPLARTAAAVTANKVTAVNGHHA